MTKWPNKQQREKFEITGFIEAYARLSEARQFEVVKRGEKPDYVVRDIATHEEFGVELTSAYIDDRSVPDAHMKDVSGCIDIPDDPHEIERYTKRLVRAVIEKVCKARAGYDRKNPLILAVYVNEYISIYLEQKGLEAFVHRYEAVFDSVEPFSEVVFWNLGNGGVFHVRPE
jgi:hypothetical protein